MLSRIIAVILLLVGIVGIGISVAGILFSFQVVDSLGAALNQTLELTSESLDTVTDTLLLTKQTVSQTGQAIGTVGETTDSVAQMLEDTRPLLDNVSTVATENIPDSLDATQQAIPNLVAVAGAIDNTLEKLSNFQYERTILGVPIGFDLGIDYQPEEPFDESVAQIGVSLEEVPDSLRGLQVHLDAANDNLAAVSGNLQTLTEDLAAIEGSVSEVGPLLDDYIRLVNEINGSITQSQANIDDQLQLVKIGLLILFVWFGLNQLVPLYLGADLITDGRLGSRLVQENKTQVAADQMAEETTVADQDGVDDDEREETSPDEDSAGEPEEEM
jgi:hypothetical protein